MNGAHLASLARLETGRIHFFVLVCLYVDTNRRYATHPKKVESPQECWESPRMAADLSRGTYCPQEESGWCSVLVCVVCGLCMSVVEVVEVRLWNTMDTAMD